MNTLLFLFGTAFADEISKDVFDLVDKKAKVSNAAEDYYTYETHHASPTPANNRYVYGYFVYEPTRRDDILTMIEKTVSTQNKGYKNFNCEKFDIAYFFIKEEVINSFDFQTSIVKTKDDYYLFVCSDCEGSETDQLSSLYSQVLDASCTSTVSTRCGGQPSNKSCTDNPAKNSK